MGTHQGILDKSRSKVCMQMRWKNCQMGWQVVQISLVSRMGFQSTGKWAQFALKQRHLKRRKCLHVLQKISKIRWPSIKLQIKGIHKVLRILGICITKIKSNVMLQQRKGFKCLIIMIRKNDTHNMSHLPAAVRSWPRVNWKPGLQPRGWQLEGRERGEEG